MSGIVGNNTNRGSGIVKAAIVGADAIDGSNIADDAIDSEHYTDGSIDNAHIADDAIDSEHYADGSIDNAHIADDAIDSEHYAAGSIDEAHIADNAVSLAKMAGGTDGQIISWDASGDPVALGPGNDGEVLTSTGAGSPPAFEAAGGGDWKKLSSTVASGASSIDITTADGIDQSLYKTYMLDLRELLVATSTAVLWLRVSDDDGSAFHATSRYQFAVHSTDNDGLEEVISGNAVQQCQLTTAVHSANQTYGIFGKIWFSPFAGANANANIYGQIAYTEVTSGDKKHGTFFSSTTTAPDSGGYDAIRIMASTGNISGTITLYGLAV